MQEMAWGFNGASMGLQRRQVTSGRLVWRPTQRLHKFDSFRQFAGERAWQQAPERRIQGPVIPDRARLAVVSQFEMFRFALSRRMAEAALRASRTVRYTSCNSQPSFTHT